jgi:ubiquinone/menaquinone biosynthesis C-methylase UbiE
MKGPIAKMDKNEVIAFFDRLAPSWDGDMITDDDKIAKIFDYAGIQAGSSILDVACGTGVLFPSYLRRNVSSITGVDISPVMIEVACKKFKDPRIHLLNADMETVSLSKSFDCCMIYNAFPHFENTQQLITNLATQLVTGGRLTIAHSMGRESLDAHHKGTANKVSNGLMHEDELAKLLEAYFHVDVKISNEALYVVSGSKK